jgi:hypothetical protein
MDKKALAAHLEGEAVKRRSGKPFHREIMLCFPDEVFGWWHRRRGADSGWDKEVIRPEQLALANAVNENRGVPHCPLSYAARRVIARRANNSLDQDHVIRHHVDD